MARKHGANIVIQHTTIACGSVDTTTKLPLAVPSSNATLRQVTYTQYVAGGTTGTFSVQIMRGTAGATAVNTATANTFIDADGAVALVHGSTEENIQVQGAEGDVLWIKTVKTGTVSADATLLLTLTWML